MSTTSVVRRARTLEDRRPTPMCMWLTASSMCRNDASSGLIRSTVTTHLRDWAQAEVRTPAFSTQSRAYVRGYCVELTAEPRGPRSRRNSAPMSRLLRRVSRHFADGGGQEQGSGAPVVAVDAGSAEHRGARRCGPSGHERDSVQVAVAAGAPVQAGAGEEHAPHVTPGQRGISHFFLGADDAAVGAEQSVIERRLSQKRVVEPSAGEEHPGHVRNLREEA